MPPSGGDNDGGAASLTEDNASALLIADTLRAIATPPTAWNVDPLVVEPAACARRVAAALKYAFVPPADDKPMPPRPAEMDEWLMMTVNGTLAGLTYGALSQYLDEKQADAYLSRQNVSRGVAIAARDMAEANSRKLVRLYSRAISGGLSIGGFCAVFFGLEYALAIARGRCNDPVNTTLGGALTCAGMSSYLGVLGGGAFARGGAAVAGAATGAVVGWPVGHIRTVSHEWMASQQMAVRVVEEASHEERPASRLMASLEAQVKDADEMVAYMQAEKARQEKSWRRYLSWTWWTSSSSSA